MEALWISALRVCIGIRRSTENVEPLRYMQRANQQYTSPRQLPRTYEDGQVLPFSFQLDVRPQFLHRVAPRPSLSTHVGDGPHAENCAVIS